MDIEKHLVTLAEEEFEKDLDKLVLEHLVPDKHVIKEEKGYKGERTVEVIIRKRIKRCFHTCPYFTLESSPSPVMICEHPQVEEQGYIISHPECDDGFPAKCPLWRERGRRK